MKKTTKKTVIIIISALLVCIVASVIVYAVVKSVYPYNKMWIMGKTSAEIIERYGEFEHFSTTPIYVDGLYIWTTAGYVLKEKGNGLFDPPSDVFFLISFDENGRAYSINDHQYRLGG